MSRFQSEARRQGVFLAIGKRSFAWTEAVAPYEPDNLHTGHLDENLHALKAVLDELRGQSIRWIFGMEQMPQWLQSPAAGARNLEELRMATFVYAKSRLGIAPGSGNEWIIDGQWHPSRPFYCRAATSKTMALLGSRPMVTSALDTGLSLVNQQVAGQWYCVSTPYEAHLVFFKSGQCGYLRSLRLAPDLPLEDVAAQLRKEWHQDTIRSNFTSDILKWMHLSAQDTPRLPDDLAWVNEPLQRHMSDRMKHPHVSEDAEDLVRTILALQSWERRR